MPHLTVVALNASAQDAAFDPIRALDIEVIHATYRSSWVEVSARRTGTAPAEQDVVPAELRDALARADVVFGFLVPRSLVVLAPKLRWVQTPATGIDHLRGTGVLESDVVVTTAGGLMAPVIAEHVLAAMLHFAKRLDRFEQQRRTHTWQMERVTSLRDRTVGLVGIGSIGAAVAALAKAFGMHVIGAGRGDGRGRHVPGIDRLLSRSELPQLLAAADYVVLAVADTPETRHLIAAPQLAAMQPHAVLINVARGTVLDEPALIEALQAQRIAGAALDVFAQEPLPATSPLWDMPQVLLTPHVAANVSDYLPRAVNLFAENIRRFLNGAPLLNTYDRARGY